MTAIKIIAEGTMKATAMMLNDVPKYKSLNGHETHVVSCIKSVLKSRVPEMMKEWKEATNANLSEAWLRELMNVQCNKYAIEALEMTLVEA